MISQLPAVRGVWRGSHDIALFAAFTERQQHLDTRFLLLFDRPEPISGPCGGDRVRIQRNPSPLI